MAASADHIKALVKSHSSRDDAAFYSVAMQVAARAARQGHHRLAADLKQLVDDARSQATTATVTPIVRPASEIAELVSVTFPAVSLRDLVVSAPVRSKLDQVVTEQRQRHRLVEQGFNPAHRLLLEGPPGTGKTMTAAVLAHELGIPLLTIRLDAVFSKFMGESGSKLRQVFEATESQRGVYLFDEFDALGGDRSGNDVGEARRILNSFLVFLEHASTESLVVASTNHRGILDRALFRRFDLVVSYSRPDEQQAAAVLKRRLGTLGRGIAWARIRPITEGLSQADLVKAAESAAKATLLAGGKTVATDTLRAAIEERSESVVA